MKKRGQEYIISEYEMDHLYEMALDNISFGNEAVLSSAKRFCGDYIQAKHWCYRKKIKAEVESIERQRQFHLETKSFGRSGFKVLRKR